MWNGGGFGGCSRVNNINVRAPIITRVVIVIFIIKFVLGGGGAGTLIYPEALYNADMFELGPIMTGAAIMAIVFVGFDSVTTFSEETINPEKNMPRAVVIICVGAAIEFFLVAYFMNCGWPYEPGAIQDPDTAITEFNVHIGIGWMNTIFILINTLASIGCCIAGQGATARILLGMGRDGFLPKTFFGYIHPKFQTPVNNIVLTTLIALTALFYQENVMGAASLVSVGAVCGFFMGNFSVIGHYISRGKERGAGAMIRHLIIPAMGMLSLLVVFYFIETPAKILGGIWIAVGIIYLAVKTKGFRELPPEMKIDE